MTDQTSIPEVQTPEYVDFFAVAERHKVYIDPQKVQYFEVKTLNEGDKTKYQKETSRDVKIDRQSGNTSLRMDAASERHSLINAAVVGWYLIRGGKEYEYTPAHLREVLIYFPPSVIEHLEKEIRKLNPWLLGEMSSEDIEKEIENLQEMLQVAREREAGEGSSSSR